MSPRLPAVQLFVTVAIIAVAALALRRAGWFDYHQLVAQAQVLRANSNTGVAALAFIGAWGVATPLGFPALPLIVTGGALFGTMPGTALSMVGTALGAFGGYFGARRVAPPRAKSWLARRLPMEEIAHGGHFMGLVRMRLIPVIPFSAVNYAAGLAAVPLGTYAATTILGQLPSTLLYSYFADRLLSAAASGADVTRLMVVLSALLLLLTLTPWTVRRLLDRRARG